MKFTALGALFLATIAAAHAEVCPDIAGTYGLSGSGDLVNDARRTLGIHPGAPDNSAVRLEGDAQESLTVTVVRRGKESPYLPVELKNGVHYLCKDGRLEFTAALNSRRPSEKGTYLGSSKVRIGGKRDIGLDIQITFTGSQSSTLYSYDSARVAVPIPFSGTTLREQLHWGASSLGDLVEPPPEPKEVQDVRALLDSKMLGAVTLFAVRANGDSVLARLSAHNKEEVARLEDQLRAASIPYEMKGPRWVGSGYYELELLVRPKGSGAPVAKGPGLLRVEQELTRIHWPNVYVKKVAAAGDGYVATLDVQGSDSVEAVILMFKRNTTLFADIRPLKETPPEAGSRTRVVQIELRVR